MRSTDGKELDHLLGEQLAYYRALAADYLDQGPDLPGGDELTEALDAFQPKGSVLELACGPGVWTSKLLRYAADVTAVDGSPEMLAVAAARVGRERVRFIRADLFTWQPDRRYDVVLIGFWLSHVPSEGFESFWALVADCLKPDGRVFFADDAYRTQDELAGGPSSSTIRRQIPDGTAYRLVKVPHQPDDLERGSANSAGTSRSLRQPDLSTGEREAKVSAQHERAAASEGWDPAGPDHLSTYAVPRRETGEE